MEICVMPSFGERLTELRKAAGLTQQQLAAKAGVSQNGISHWEQGSRSPSWEAVVKLCRALGVSCGVFEDVDAGEPPSHRPRGRPKRE